MRAITLVAIGLFACGAAFAQTQPSTSEPARKEAPLPEKVKLPETPGEGPTVKIRQHDNGDTIEEYRENGKLTMVKVTPPNGVAYTLLDTNGDGLLDRSDSDGPVGPVYYTLYRWN